MLSIAICGAVKQMQLREKESHRERANFALAQKIRTRESANENNQQIYK